MTSPFSRGGKGKVEIFKHENAEAERFLIVRWREKDEVHPPQATGLNSRNVI
jgi:hypothetical protein